MKKFLIILGSFLMLSGVTSVMYHVGSKDENPERNRLYLVVVKVQDYTKELLTPKKWPWKLVLLMKEGRTMDIMVYRECQCLDLLLPIL